MAETFLEEQLKRIREMSEQLSRLHGTAVEHDKVRKSSDDEKGSAPSEPPRDPHAHRESCRRRHR